MRPSSASHRLDVLVVGSVNIDTALSVPRLPRSGETIASTDLAERGGGKGANQAFAAARAGGRTALLAAVGADADPALRDLRTVEVDLSGLVDTELPTGRAVLLLTETDNAIVIAEGANGALEPVHVEQWAGAHAVPAAVVLQHEVPQPVVEAALAAFGVRESDGESEADDLSESGDPDHRARVFLNPSPWRDGVSSALEAADVLVVNEGELALAAGLGPVDLDAKAAERVLAGLRGGDVVVTLGGDGALVREDALITRIPAERIEAVDTVGAGDSFLGTLATAVAHGASLVDAARAATAAAARVVAIHAARDVPE